MWSRKLIILMTSLGLLHSTHVLAAVSDKSEAQLESDLQKITQQTAELQKEIVSLKSELKQVKQQQRVVATRTQSSPAQKKPPTTIGTDLAAAPTVVAGKNVTHTSSGEVSGYKPGMLLSPSVALNAKGQPLLTADEETSQERNADVTYLMGSYVLSSQILNIHSSYNGSDLLVNLPNMNEDLRFLQQRQTLESLIGVKNLPSSYRPQVFLSGKVEPQFIYFSPYNNSPQTTTINLGSAEFDVLAEASPWAYGFLSIAFDGSPLKNPLTIGSGNPVNNSRLFLNRGFITIGNLDRSPIYMSAGQEYVPFGDYTAFQITNPVTKIEGRTDARTIVFGYYKEGLYLAAYVFDGAVQTANSNNINEGGLNAGYKNSSADGKYTADIGMGYINNIAEAQGYQLNGETGTFVFQGFSQRGDTEDLDHQVGGVDAHLGLVMGPFSIYSELVAAARHFDPMDLAYDNNGAQPSAFHAEGDYATQLLTKPITFTLAYEHTWQSLALNVPQNSFIGVINMSIWKNTIETLEYRHDMNYSANNSAGGICDPTGAGITTFCYVPSTGGSQNIVLAQIGVYF